MPTSLGEGRYRCLAATARRRKVFFRMGYLHTSGVCGGGARVVRVGTRVVRGREDEQGFGSRSRVQAA